MEFPFELHALKVSFIQEHLSLVNIDESKKNTWVYQYWWVSSVPMPNQKVSEAEMLKHNIS